MSGGKQRPPRLPDRVLAELAGSDWTVERGSKHWLLKIGGHQVVVIGQGGFLRGDHGSSRITAAAIRRFRRHHEEGARS